MTRDPRVLLWEAREAARAVSSFIADRTVDDYEADLLLRSGVERQLGIIGEALNVLRQQSPDVAGRIGDLARIIGLRNRLIHGYSAVDDATVWSAATEEVPALIAALTPLLEANPE